MLRTLGSDVSLTSAFFDAPCTSSTIDITLIIFLDTVANKLQQSALLNLPSLLSTMQAVRQSHDRNSVGLSRAVLKREATVGRRHHPQAPGPEATIEDEEAYARKMQQKNAFILFFDGTLAALQVFAIYLITLDTIVSMLACVGMTMYWYIYSVSTAVAVQSQER